MRAALDATDSEGAEGAADEAAGGGVAAAPDGIVVAVIGGLVEPRCPTTAHAAAPAAPSTATVAPMISGARLRLPLLPADGPRDVAPVVVRTAGVEVGGVAAGAVEENGAAEANACRPVAAGPETGARTPSATASASICWPTVGNRCAASRAHERANHESTAAGIHFQRWVGG